MKILLLTRSFNSLCQRLYVELAARNHALAVEFDIADSVTEEAVDLFGPDLVLAPYMKRAIPERVWRRVRCLVVHPGIVGDRGPSALDWAVADGEREWGVTVLQAEAELDAGPVWASETFAMREGATKSSLYRNEVTEAAVRAVLTAIDRVRSGSDEPVYAVAGAPGVRGRARPLMTQADRAIDWQRETTQALLRKLAAADGAPGVRDELFGAPVLLFDARAGERVDAAPGTLVARRGDAVQRATVDGSVWIGHCRRLDAPADTPAGIKLPVGVAFAAPVAALPAAGADRRIVYEEPGDEERPIGVLHFDFYNGAMSTTDCERLLAAYREALARPTRVLLLAGGPDFFSNGIHLNVIEAADSPADESWLNINAMDDLCEAVLRTTDRLVIAALQGNAGAGGVFLALTADATWARSGVILNPHYRNMGNLYGSEYWTYTLPRRTRGPGQDAAAAGLDPRRVMQNRLPLSAARAKVLGLVDAVFGATRADFMIEAVERARRLAANSDYPVLVRDKAKRLKRAEEERPLAAYRADELAHMRRNFYGFDPSYHVARSYFVHKTPPSWTPRHLATHRLVPQAAPAPAASGAGPSSTLTVAPTPAGPAAASYPVALKPRLAAE